MQMKDHTDKDSAKTQEADPNIMYCASCLESLDIMKGDVEFSRLKLHQRIEKLDRIAKTSTITRN